MKPKVLGLETHQYAPELNKLHYTNGHSVSIPPDITRVEDAIRYLRARNQPARYHSHQFTIDVIHPDNPDFNRVYTGYYGHLALLLDDFRTIVKRKHNVEGTKFKIHVKPVMTNRLLLAKINKR